MPERPGRWHVSNIPACAEAGIPITDGSAKWNEGVRDAKPEGVRIRSWGRGQARQRGRGPGLRPEPLLCSAAVRGEGGSRLVQAGQQPGAPRPWRLPRWRPHPIGGKGRAELGFERRCSRRPIGRAPVPRCQGCEAESPHNTLHQSHMSGRRLHKSSRDRRQPDS